LQGRIVSMEVTVRLVEGEPTVAVHVFWHGAELNLNRAHEEPVERFLQRLGLSCSKYAGRQTGGDRKRAKKKSAKNLGRCLDKKSSSRCLRRVMALRWALLIVGV